MHLAYAEAPAHEDASGALGCKDGSIDIHLTLAPGM
jgi:hypothetical protein